MISKLRCLILDDEQYARVLLEQYVQKLPSLELIGKCKNPLEAYALKQRFSVDLIFLDIQMPELTGIEFLHTLQEKPMAIFTTAFPEYAMDGYELDVVDYLLKPIRFERFLKAVNKASNRVQVTRTTTRVAQPALENVPFLLKSDSKDYLLVKSEHRVHKIKYDQICYIKGMKEYVVFKLFSGRVFSLLSLKSLEEELPNDQFVRIHKSYIVSIEKINILEGNQIHVGQEKLPIGNSYKNKVLSQIF